MILSADLLLWLNAVTEDTIHEEIELEKDNDFTNTKSSEADTSDLEGSPSEVVVLSGLGLYIFLNVPPCCFQDSPT